MTRTWLPALGALLLAVPLPAAAQADDWSDPFTYEEVWARPQHGWGDFVAESRRDPVSRTRIRNYLQLKLRDRWALSHVGDGYKNFRDLIAELHQAGEALGEDKAASRALLHEAVQNLDRYMRDEVPDNLYAFLKTP